MMATGKGCGGCCVVRRWWAAWASRRGSRSRSGRWRGRGSGMVPVLRVLCVYGGCGLERADEWADERADERAGGCGHSLSSGRRGRAAARTGRVWCVLSSAISVVSSSPRAGKRTKSSRLLASRPPLPAHAPCSGDFRID